MDIYDRIKGVIVGLALGDAVGLSNGNFPYETKIHPYEPCSWTEETDCAIVSMQHMIKHYPAADPANFSQMLADWSENGISGGPDGEKRPPVVNPILGALLADPDFRTNPSAASQKLWESRGRNITNNGALPRVTACGCVPHVQELIRLTVSDTAVTHFDPKCVCASIIYTTLIYNIVNGLQPSLALQEAIKHAREMCEATRIDFGKLEGELSEYCRVGMNGFIDDLELDDLKNHSHVFKTLSCAIYALQLIVYSQENNAVPSYKKIITQIASQRGDSDANAGVAGAILGGYLGYSRLPKDWLASLRNREFLETQIDQFMDADWMSHEEY